MGELIVIEFVTLDGVVEDPDGSGATLAGGWAFRHGPEAVAGDKFDLGPLLDTGVMLFGRTTWELFTKIWSGRTDPFSAKLNAIPKLVASRTLTSATGWRNSTLISGDLVSSVQRAKASQDVIMTGSVSLAHELADLVDEYRLMVFPTVAGSGRRLFSAQPMDLRLTSVEQKGAAALMRYRK
ncbi:dihydrofolate reductase family protein [Amycolatopsis rhabdoformis]|uniref:Dihydrofolate reductase family protein n=1 Tax=Amycolatopsis rhabdoformis TaxID=1448059 RepID=A0ABZ1HVZ4_9PSEU|nr:dihydrofolate reductase family protein [Amycolatopsis rhabdoformis]WSE26416.1 dihydrofolate reductase family protein [Amycolatopsis rhabdoformis]